MERENGEVVCIGKLAGGNGSGEMGKRVVVTGMGVAAPNAHGIG